MKQSSFSISIAAILLLSFTACKKENSPAIPSHNRELLIGTWNLVQFGNDSNRNQMLDGAEADTNIDKAVQTLTFKTDSTAEEITDFHGFTGFSFSRWQLYNNGQSLQFIGTAADTTHKTILILDSLHLTLYDSEVAVPLVSVYNRK